LNHFRSLAEDFEQQSAPLPWDTGNQNLQSVLDREAGRNQQNVLRETLILRVSDFVQNLEQCKDLTHALAKNWTPQPQGAATSQILVSLQSRKIYY